MDPGKNPLIDSNPLNESACRGNKNTVVYTGGDKRYLESLKKDSPTCFTVTTDKSVWTKARGRLVQESLAVLQVPVIQY